MPPTSISEVSPPPLKRRKVSPPAKPAIETAAATSDVVPTPVVTLDLPRRALRVFSWNVNGITPFLPPTTAKITTFLKAPPKATTSNHPSNQPSLRACLRKWSWPHILCLQEVKIAPSDTKTQTTIRRTVNSPLYDEDAQPPSSHQYDAHFCLPRDKYNATGFGGKVHGVCALIRRDLPNVEVKTVKWDLEGRVLIAELRDDCLAVFNIYAVNGTTYDYRSPETGKVIGTRHDRKRAFHGELCGEIRRYEAQGWNVLVIGDMNISRTKMDSFPQLRMGEEHVRNRADFERKFIQDLDMIDTFRHMHGEKKKYSYRPTHKPWGGGGDRVDMALVTRGLAGRLGKADILDTEDDRGPSDHVPLFVCLTGYEHGKNHREQDEKGHKIESGENE